MEGNRKKEEQVGRSWKAAWLSFVQRQTQKTAQDPYARAKVMGWVIVVLIIGFGLPKGESIGISCVPCLTWAAQFCSGLISAGGACAAVAAFPPALCACILAAGGGLCLAAAGTCAVACIVA